MYIMWYNKNNNKIVFKKGAMSAHFIKILALAFGRKNLLISFLVLSYNIHSVQEVRLLQINSALTKNLKNLIKI